jgi:hypothetical protein
MVKPVTHQSRKLTTEECTDLIRRGLSAWFGSGDAVPPDAAGQPVAARMATKTKPSEGDAEPHLLHFVAVHAGAVVLAVYRVRNDNLGLRRLVRPPKDLVRLKG